MQGLLDGASRGDASRHDRDEFDHLRSHEPGEAIDRVNWKATAKRPDHELMVSEYRSDVPQHTLTVAGDAVPGKADTLAETVAGIVTYLLDTHPGIAVGVAVPAGSIDPATGENHRMALLRLLAETGSGSTDSGR
ncbi:MAG: DUF58 domain-containing protein [Natrialbaceae archaeon]|nr:DUF58 domain-containing protein [Natrialbaceae archaeon]